MKIAKGTVTLTAAVVLLVSAAPVARGEDAALEAKIVDSQSGRTKATFMVSSPISTPPSRRAFVYHRNVRLPRPVGPVAVDAQVQFLGFTKKEVWFAINTEAATTNKKIAGVRRVIKATASVPYGQSHRIDDLFSTNGNRLSLVITPTKQKPEKPGFSLRRLFGRGNTRPPDGVHASAATMQRG